MLIARAGRVRSPSPPRDEPPADETNWGNTAVLEPPREGADEPRGVLDGEPAVEFPAGFPIIDGEVVEVKIVVGGEGDVVGGRGGGSATGAIDGLVEHFARVAAEAGTDDDESL